MDAYNYSHSEIMKLTKSCHVASKFKFLDSRGYKSKLLVDYVIKTGINYTT